MVPGLNPNTGAPDTGGTYSDNNGGNQDNGNQGVGGGGDNSQDGARVVISLDPISGRQHVTTTVTSGGGTSTTSYVKEGTGFGGVVASPAKIISSPSEATPINPAPKQMLDQQQPQLPPVQTQGQVFRVQTSSGNYAASDYNALNELETTAVSNARANMIARARAEKGGALNMEEMEKGYYSDVSLVKRALTKLKSGDTSQQTLADLYEYGGVQFETKEKAHVVSEVINDAAGRMTSSASIVGGSSNAVTPDSPLPHIDTNLQSKISPEATMSVPRKESTIFTRFDEAPKGTFGEFLQAGFNAVLFGVPDAVYNATSGVSKYSQEQKGLYLNKYYTNRAKVTADGLLGGRWEGTESFTVISGAAEGFGGIVKIPQFVGDVASTVSIYPQMIAESVGGEGWSHNPKEGSKLPTSQQRVREVLLGATVIVTDPEAVLQFATAMYVGGKATNAGIGFFQGKTTIKTSRVAAIIEEQTTGPSSSVIEVQYPKQKPVTMSIPTDSTAVAYPIPQARPVAPATGGKIGYAIVSDVYRGKYFGNVVAETTPSMASKIYGAVTQPFKQLAAGEKITPYEPMSTFKPYGTFSGEFTYTAYSKPVLKVTEHFGTIPADALTEITGVIKTTGNKVRDVDIVQVVQKKSSVPFSEADIQADVTHTGASKAKLLSEDALGGIRKMDIGETSGGAKINLNVESIAKDSFMPESKWFGWDYMINELIPSQFKEGFIKQENINGNRVAYPAILTLDEVREMRELVGAVKPSATRQLRITYGFPDEFGATRTGNMGEYMKVSDSKGYINVWLDRSGRVKGGMIKSLQHELVHEYFERAPLRERIVIALDASARRYVGGEKLLPYYEGTIQSLYNPKWLARQRGKIATVEWGAPTEQIKPLGDYVRDIKRGFQIRATEEMAWTVANQKTSRFGTTHAFATELLERNQYTGRTPTMDFGIRTAKADFSDAIGYVFEGESPRINIDVDNIGSGLPSNELMKIARARKEGASTPSIEIPKPIEYYESYGEGKVGGKKVVAKGISAPVFMVQSRLGEITVSIGEQVSGFAKGKKVTYNQPVDVEGFTISRIGQKKLSMEDIQRILNNDEMIDAGNSGSPKKVSPWSRSGFNAEDLSGSPIGLPASIKFGELAMTPQVKLLSEFSVGFGGGAGGIINLDNFGGQVWVKPYIPPKNLDRGAGEGIVSTERVIQSPTKGGMIQLVKVKELSQTAPPKLMTKEETVIKPRVVEKTDTYLRTEYDKPIAVTDMLEGYKEAVIPPKGMFAEYVGYRYKYSGKFAEFEGFRTFSGSPTDSLYQQSQKQREAQRERQKTGEKVKPPVFDVPVPEATDVFSLTTFKSSQITRERQKTGEPPPEKIQIDMPPSPSGGIGFALPSFGAGTKEKKTGKKFKFNDLWDTLTVERKIDKKLR
jgi:hypothetical protein